MEEKRRGMPAWAIVVILAVVLVPLLLNVFLMPGGGGSGAYAHYAGPVLPMTSLSGAEGIEVTRNVDFDFHDYSQPRENILDNGFAAVTDSYILTNTGGEATVVELAYGFEGQFVDPLDEFPRITVDGTEASGDIYATVDIFRDIHHAGNWESYQKALEENDFLTSAMEQPPQWDAPVTVYHFTDVSYEKPEVEDTIHYGVQFAVPEGSEIWVREFGITRVDEETGEMQLYFREEWGEGWMFVLGDVPEKMTPIGNVGFNVTESSALAGLTMEVETWEASFRECLWDFAQEYDFWGIHDSYPDPGLVTPELLYQGAMKRITDPDYRHSSGDIRTMSGVFYDVIVEDRMLYKVFTVEIPAGETVTVSAAYTQHASTDTGGPKTPREGYDMATRLGSGLNFTEQTASLTNSHLIEILKQNFGFDLKKDITKVTLDLDVERYYLDVAAK